jgi:hypothetical protein
MRATPELAKENGMSEKRGDTTSAQAKWLEYFKVPGVDNKALLESQRRNIEALTRATEVATDGRLPSTGANRK